MGDTAEPPRDGTREPDQDNNIYDSNNHNNNNTQADTDADAGGSDEGKPTLLLVLSTVRGPEDTPAWREVLSRFRVVRYDCASVEEFCARLRDPAPGNPYARLDAILRTGWLKAGPYADHALFRGPPLDLFPPTLRFVGCSGHGYDAADVGALAARGVAYANTPDACTEAVANAGLYLILNAYRHFTLAERCARLEDGWAASRAVGEVADDPRGQVLGVVGLGDIGLAVARKAALALGMEIHYHNRRRRPPAELEAELLPLPPSAVTYHATFESLLGAADCVFLACPLTPATRHLISAGSLARVAHRRIRIVNVARGGLIDEEALLAALDRGQVAGVGLDVHASEPGVHPRLRARYDVTVLPHVGVASRASWRRFDEVNLRNLTEFFFGDKGKVTIVNRDLLKDI